VFHAASRHASHVTIAKVTVAPIRRAIYILSLA
jgi:hypothetical protein